MRKRKRKMKIRLKRKKKKFSRKRRKKLIQIRMRKRKMRFKINWMMIMMTQEMMYIWVKVLEAQLLDFLFTQIKILLFLLIWRVLFKNNLMINLNKLMTFSLK
jgi:hypothetical protein